jgi:aspartate aminotransferase
MSLASAVRYGQDHEALSDRPFASVAPSIIDTLGPACDEPDVIALWYGEPDLATPAFVSAAAQRFLRGGHTFYADRRGIPPLRQALAEYETRLRGRTIAPERITITTGGMSAIMLSFQALVRAGENIVIIGPAWPNIKAAVQILGGEPRLISLDFRSASGWHLDLERVIDACDTRTRAIFVNSPSNPTGWIMERAEAEALLDFTRRRSIWLISDEVYSRFVYNRRPAAPSVLDIAKSDDRVIVVNSFSKLWAMTGWRLGWLIAPEALDPVWDKLIEVNTLCAPPFLQYAAITALEEGEPFVRRMLDHCHLGRRLACEGLSRFPRVDAPLPAGTFYLFFAIDGMSDSCALAREILTRCKVGLAPGAVFGPSGAGFLRLCFAQSPQRLLTAINRLARVLS